jgi:hypothetical protein
VAAPLDALVAVALTAYEPGITIAGDVTVSVEVPVAPTASVSVEVENVPVNGGVVGTVRVNENELLAHPPVSLFVTLTV